MTRPGRHVEGTLIDRALARAEVDPDEQVFLGEDRPVTFGSLLQEADALAVALWDLGLRPGHVIAFQLPNWVEAAVVNLAAVRLGLVCAPLLPLYRESELAFMIADSCCRVVFIPDTFRSFDFIAMYARLRMARTDGPLLITVRSTSSAEARYEDLIAAGRGRAIAWPRVAAEAVKLRLYTSGTTGCPKAVLHDHMTLTRAILTSVAHWRIEPGDVVLMPSPVTHATGYANALELPFLQGTRTVLMERWDAEQAVDLIDRYAVVATVGATPFLKELTAAACKLGSHLATLRIFACGGAAVPPEVIRAANHALKNRPAFRVYGSSEAPYVALGSPLERSDDFAATTDGEVIDYDVRIVDDRGTDVAAGGEGEIVVRGPALFLGYARDTDNSDCFTADGYFRTGDMGRLGPGTHLTITGRKKDLIIRGGENISAKEIEDILHGHPGVAEAAVVAMRHERLGEGVFAFVIARDGAVPTLNDLTAYLASRGLSHHKHPERLALVEQLPRTASGKIRKDILRSRAVAILGNSDDTPRASA